MLECSFGDDAVCDVVTAVLFCTRTRASIIIGAHHRFGMMIGTLAMRRCLPSAQ